MQTSADIAPNAVPALASETDLAALRESITDVLNAECGRRAVHDFIDGRTQLDRTLWTQAAELGWLAVGLPEAYGGLGLGPQGSTVLHRELGRFTAPGPFIAALAGGDWLATHAEVTCKDAWLPAIAGGELRIAVAAQAVAGGNLVLDQGRLRGRSALLLGAADSGLVIAPAVGAGGTVLWVAIEAGPQAVLEPASGWDRTRGLCSLACDGVQPAAVIEDARAGETLARSLALAPAADSLGGAEAITAQTIDYLNQRVQFGRPIGSFQAIKHRAADLHIQCVTQENLLEQAVESAALGSPDANLWAALAKAGAANAYAFIAADCVQLHGGIGFTWEYDCHLFLKRARLNQMLGGTDRTEYDAAAAGLAEAARAGRSTAELAAGAAA